MQILNIIYIVVAAFALLIGTIIPFILKMRAFGKVKTEAERDKLLNDMLSQAQAFIADAEEQYAAIDVFMKQNGSSCSAMKKDSVLAKLQTLAINLGVKFDTEFWSQKIDELVSFTKKVNHQ